jgi:hypothetical protein
MLVEKDLMTADTQYYRLLPFELKDLGSIESDALYLHFEKSHSMDNNTSSKT